MGMTALPIVKHFDIFKNIFTRFFAGLVVLVMNKLYLRLSICPTSGQNEKR
jgi:hypothetical protein